MAIRMCGPNCKSQAGEACTDSQVTYEGAVLAVRERNGYDDSDFYAVVWDDARREIVEIEYATTRFWTYHNSATVDATPDVLRKAGRWLKWWVYRQWKAQTRWLATRPEIGRVVKVVRGRKVPIGTIGRVGWIGKSQFNKNQLRLRIDAEGKSWFVADYNVEVLNPREYMDSATVGKAIAERAAKFPLDGIKTLWRGLLVLNNIS